MRKTLIIALLLAVSASLTAQQPDVHADANPAAEGEIKARKLKLAELIVQGKWDEYAKHVASDYLHTRDNGHVEGKDAALAKKRLNSELLGTACTVPIQAIIPKKNCAAAMRRAPLRSVRPSFQLRRASSTAASTPAAISTRRITRTCAVWLCPDSLAPGCFQ